MTNGFRRAQPTQPGTSTTEALGMTPKKKKPGGGLLGFFTGKRKPAPVGYGAVHAKKYEEVLK